VKKILIAGIGNIFYGDDAFGCEVIRHLNRQPLPTGVSAIDFGIRSYDLACALMEDYDAVILVDAAGRGEKPGTVYLMEPEASRPDQFERVTVDAHAMNPVSVIQMAQSFGGVNTKLYLVGCEPAVLESHNGEMGLSPEILAAVPKAAELTTLLVKELLPHQEKTVTNLQAAVKE